MKFVLSIVITLFLAYLGPSEVDALTCSPCLQRECTREEIVRRGCKPKGGLVYDICGCCKMCAMLEGERCGGPWDLFGFCDKGLRCDQEDDLWDEDGGVCVPIKKKTQVCP